MGRFALLLLVAPGAWSCVCTGRSASVKQAWKAAPGVFLGTVELADPDQDSTHTVFQAQFVRIRVDEAFKGVSTGQIIELHQGRSDCDAKFRTGQRAVFYLYRGTERGSWVVPFCTYVLGNAEAGGDDLLFLRGLPRSATGTRLSGEVRFYENSPTDGFRELGGADNVKVKISGPRGFARQVVTNSAGACEVYGLQPGTYSVSIEVPKGWKGNPQLTGSRFVKYAAKLAPNGDATVGFTLQADTRLSGHIIDANGAPVEGVCLNLESIARGEDVPYFFACSKTGGVFHMDMMAPGTYVIVAHDEFQAGSFKSKSTLYYPGVRDRERAAKISIEAEHYLENLDIRPPPQEKRHEIAGRLEFADGTAVANGTVAFSSPGHGYTEVEGTATDGRFRLPVTAGMEGQLTGEIAVFASILQSCPQFQVETEGSGMLRIMRSKPISLSVDSDRADVKLVLPSPSCKAWPRGRGAP